MSYKAIALVLVGIVIGSVGSATIGPVLTREVTLGAAAAPEQSQPPARKYTRLTTPRIPPVKADTMTPEQKAIGGNANIAIALNNPALAKAWWAWLTYVYDIQGTRGNAALNLMDKEILLLRTSFLTHDDWLWGMHVPMAKEYGRTDVEIARIAKGPNAPGWSDKDKALMSAADELHYDSFISDDTWKKLTSHYNTQQMLEILFVVGTYHTSAYYANSTGLPYAPGRNVGLPVSH